MNFREGELRIVEPFVIILTMGSTVQVLYVDICESHICEAFSYDKKEAIQCLIKIVQSCV